jgi:hypothetical protein
MSIGIDPLHKNVDSVAKHLMMEWIKLAAGRSREAACLAAINIIINCIRQCTTQKSDAEAKFNELFGRGKQVMLDHYDSTTGLRKSKFSYTQVIEVPHFIDPDILRGRGPGSGH